MEKFLFLCLAYFLGSIPFGVLVSKWVKGIDIREHGSRNTGATNVYRVVGKGWGVTVFILDALKGYLAVRLSSYTDMNAGFSLAIGLTAILGHSFSLWLGFKGGKGVATSLGVFLGIVPAAALITLFFWFLILLWKRILSLASLGAAILFPFVVLLTSFKRPGYEWLQAGSLFITFFIFYTHRANIDRLKKGNEPLFWGPGPIK